MKAQKLIFVFTLAILLLPSLASAQKVYSTYIGGAINGYDPVAYFSLAKGADGVKGSSKYSYKYRGFTWYFSSQKNLDAFKANPKKYTPEYGGYCAYALATKGKLVSSDGDAWSIVNGKLYLNYSKSVRSKWNKDIPGFIKKGDAAWPKVAN